MDRKTYQKWKELLSEYWSGGLSMNEYCRRRQLNPKTANHWKNIIQKERMKNAGDSAELEIVPLNLAGGISSSVSGIRLKIGNVCIELQKDFDIQTLKKVFSLLEAR